MLTYLLYTACATALAALICVTAVFASEIDMKNMSTRLSILLACLLVVGGAASIGFRQAVADKAWTRRNIDIEEAQKSLANADFSLSCLPDGSVPDTRGSVADVSPCAERGSLRIVRSATNGRYRYFPGRGKRQPETAQGYLGLPAARGHERRPDEPRGDHDVRRASTTHEIAVQADRLRVETP
jgi:hypothetical protein